MELQSQAETLDQIGIAIQVRLFRRPVERASGSIDRRKRRLHIDALDHDPQSV